MNVIMGLPRSGSTLLCNVLAQNPAFKVEHTNPLPNVLRAMMSIWSQDPDIKGGLQEHRVDETEARLLRCARAVCDSWANTDKTYFNKSRGWAGNVLALQQAYPAAKVIVTVRDPREVFASFEKQHRKFPLLDDAQNEKTRNIYQRALQMFSPQGMIGSCLEGVKDVLDRRLEVFWFRYEDFVRNPQEMMERLYAFCDFGFFEHDFDNVVNTATDPDHLYNNKFPHKGEGKIENRAPAWPKVMSREIAAEVMAGFPWYCSKFGYASPRRPAGTPEPMPMEQTKKRLGMDHPENGNGNRSHPAETQAGLLPPSRLKHPSAQ